MQNHYLHYLTNVMSHQWSDPALTDYGEDHEYSFGGLAVEMLRLHTLFEQLGIKRGDKIALAGRNCANWAVAYLAVAAYEKRLSRWKTGKYSIITRRHKCLPQRSWRLPSRPSTRMV